MDIATKLFESVLDCVKSSSHVNGLIIVDTSVGNGAFLQAFLVLRRGVSVPMYYFGLCSDSNAKEWVIEHTVHRVPSKIEKLRYTLARLCRYRCRGLGAFPKRDQ